MEGTFTQYFRKIGGEYGISQENVDTFGSLRMVLLRHLTDDIYGYSDRYLYQFITIT
jgi:hypothetical protein